MIWKVNNIIGGNGSVGTISTSGLYRAPNTVPNPAVVTVSATAAADPSKTANAAVTISKKERGPSKRAVIGGEAIMTMP